MLKPAKLAPLLPALIIAACTAVPPPPPPPPTAELPQWGQGIDLATDSSDVLSELKSSRVDFVARYYRNPDSRFPALSPSEAQRLSSSGIKIVAVWEAHSRDPAYFSYSQGYRDATIGYGEARAIGQPAGSAIYFAVDFNAQWLFPIDEYFRGIAAGLTAANGGHADYAVGVYGSGLVCDELKRSGLARYCWLSNAFAWDGSTAYEDWNIRQGSRLPELSFNQDSDEARNEYGAFRVSDSGVAPRSGSGDFTAPTAPQAGPAPALAATPTRYAEASISNQVAPFGPGDSTAPRAPQVADTGAATRSASGDITVPPAPPEEEALASADIPFRSLEASTPTGGTRRHSHHRSSGLRYAEARIPGEGAHYIRVQYASAAGKTVRHRVASGAPSSVSTAARHRAKCGVARCASSAASSR
jgi:hypothetical protein